MKEISANDNPVIKKFRALSLKKQRDKLGLYLIEGPNLLEEALNCQAKIGQILFDDEALSRSEELAGLAARAEERRIPSAVASPSLFLKAANTDTPQGVIAWVEKPRWTEEQFFAPAGGNIIVLDRLQDPGNLGTILRTADSAGFSGALILKGSGDIYGPKTVRAATGTLFRLPVLFSDGPEEAMSLLRNHGKKVFATALENSETYFACDLRYDAAIVIGNEGNGICQEILTGADQNITIPMEGKTESLNAGIAAGVLMYEALRQRHMDQK
ncbi:MAG: RNA methyltransferase [Firmicutes bacterium]|nr:RNA methyltransferase [Bacillota bacterium]